MSAESHFQHELYQEASNHIQRGEWKAGLSKLEKLIRLFPLEQELRSLRKELIFKRHFDHAEERERSAAKRRRLSGRALQAVAFVAVIAIGYLAISSYSGWAVGQLTEAGQRAEEEIRTLALTALHRDAVALLQVGRLAEAEAVVEDIAGLDAGFPGLVQLRAQIDAEIALASLYQLAMQQLDTADWLAARETLELLADREPNYRDIDIQMMYIDRQVLLGNLLDEAEAAIASNDWEQAVTSFEAVRTLHPEHDPEYVDARLFESLVNAARGMLLGQEDSLAALEGAEVFLRRALSLKPQDSNIKRERELAGLFLKSQADFDQGNWSEVIDALGRAVQVDPTYAQGTARQTLYDAYVARGESQMSAGSYEAAMNDFERAVDLGKQDPEAALRLYEAELKVAEAYGATGNFEAAVVHYRGAIEWGNLAVRAADNPAVLNALQEAEAYASRGNFGVAYESFQRAIRLANAVQATRYHVVQEGEYLTLLASRYGSTVRSIASANDIENRNLIFPGQELLIPVLP